MKRISVVKEGFATSVRIGKGVYLPRRRSTAPMSYLAWVIVKNLPKENGWSKIKVKPRDIHSKIALDVFFQYIGRRQIYPAVAVLEVLERFPKPFEYEVVR
jgi:hypothetical protein